MVKKNIHKIGILILILAITTLGMPVPNYATTYSANLIINGDGESNNFVGWTLEGDYQDSFINGTYADALYTNSPDSGLSGFDYYPGAVGSATIYQSIDISDLAQAVDQGAVTFDAQGYIRRVMDQSEAKITVEQLDDLGGLITGGKQEMACDLASPTAEQLASGTWYPDWQLKSVANIAVLSGARSIKITLTATISDQNASSDYIEFDDIRLTLTQIGVTMNITGNGNTINTGDTTPSITDDTNFGSVLASSGTITKTFTIQNSDTTGLSLTINPTINIAGANAVDFSVSAAPAITTLADGATTTFGIQFNPSDLGTRTATITVNNNTEAGSYTFTVQGTGNPDPLVIDTTDPVAGTVGTVYGGHSFSSTGGTGSKTYAVTSGTLPTGLSLASNGALSGTPTSYGSFTFTVTVTDSATTPVTDGHSYSMTISPAALVIDTTNPVAGTVGTIYGGHTFSSTGGTGSKTYAVTSGTLPTGLSLASNGDLSGTPTSYGSFTFTVTVTDSATTPVTDGHSYSMTINPAALVIDTTNPAAGTVGTAYGGHTFSSTGGTGSKTYAVTSGTLPTGLSLASNGTLSGTPTSYGSFTFTVTATDSATTPVTDGHSYSMTINPAALVIDTTNPVAGTVGIVYGGHTFSSTGGTGSKTYAVTSGTLPTGLSLASNGTLSGTPTALGSFTFTVTATDSATTPVTDGHSYSMTITPVTLLIDTTNPTAGTVGTAYGGHTFSSTGGTGSKTYAVTSGILPTGLSLASNGTLSGTPTSYGSFTFTVTVTDSATTPVTDGHSYSMTINPAALQIDTTSPAAGTVGIVYGGHTFSSTGGTGSKTYAVTSGTLPTGLSLASSGVLSGTPTSYGSFTFTVTATDSATTPLTDGHSYSMMINPAALAIDTTNPVAGTVGIVYGGHTFSSTGGTGSKTYAVTSGTLPTGLSLASNGVLSGTPTALGSFTFTVTATDSATTPVTDGHSYSMTITPVTLLIDTTNPTAGTVGTAYGGHTFSSTGGTGSKTYAVTSGTLPTGLSLASNGTLSGTPTSYGSFTFTVTVTDSATTPVTDSHSFNMSINSLSLVIDTTNPAAGTVGTVYGGYTFSSTGGTGSKTYTVTSGTLPIGLSLASNGALSGTPTSYGSFTFTVTVTDSASTPVTDHHEYVMIINSEVLKINTNNPVAGTVGIAYAGHTFTATGGTGSKTYAVTSGALPAGLSLATNGTLSGIPTTSGSSIFIVTATDSVFATNSHEYSMLISQEPLALSISTTNPAEGIVGVAYVGHVFTVTGGTGIKTYAITAGVLPAGLTLASNGILSGAPTVSGNFTFMVTATDSTSATDSHEYSITINPETIPLVINTANPLTGTVETSYVGHTFTATGGTGSKTYVITAGTLPIGLTLASNGSLSGTPTEAGTFIFTVTVTDSASISQTDSHQYAMIVKSKDNNTNNNDKGDNSSGGSSSSPSSSATPEVNGPTISVVGNDPVQTEALSNLKVTSILDKVGNSIFQVKVEVENTQEIVKNLALSGGKIAKINMSNNDAGKPLNISSQVVLPRNTLQIFSDNDINLEIKTDNASVSIPSESMNMTGSPLQNDLYFNIRPVIDQAEETTVVNNLKSDTQMKLKLENSALEMIGTPVVVETNFPSVRTKLTLPIQNIVIPADDLERKLLEESLSIYIDHSDGEKEIKKGTLVESEMGKWGIQFDIDKYSVFTIYRDVTAIDSPEATQEVAPEAAPSDSIETVPEVPLVVEPQNENVQYIFIATKYDNSDAFAGSVYAMITNGILLRTGNTALDFQRIADEILNASQGLAKIYIFGLEKAISSNLENILMSNGINGITRIGGADKYETAKLIAEKMNLKDKGSIVLSSGKTLPADTSEIARICAELQAPILFTAEKTLPDSTVEAIKKLNPKSIYVLPNVNEILLNSLENSCVGMDVEIIRVKDASEIK